jgi:cysteine desulfurase
MLPEAVETVTAAVAAALSAAGNASSLHAAGRRARRVVEESRERLAAAVGARPSEVVFTGSGTESDNLAVKGIWWSRRDADPRRTRVLASAVEHHAVLDAAQWLADHEGAVVEWLEVDDQGRVHPDVLREAIERDPSDVALVSVMWANNEVGTVQPVRRLPTSATSSASRCTATRCRRSASCRSTSRQRGRRPDAHRPQVRRAASASVRLVLGRDVACTPLLHGGGQERDVRSGTLDTPAVAGLAWRRRSPSSDNRAARPPVGLRDELVGACRRSCPGGC